MNYQEKTGGKTNQGVQLEFRVVKSSPEAKLNSKLSTQTGIPGDGSIRWKMVLDSIQYPLTLTSLMVCIISIIYLVSLSRMFGFGLTAITLSLISGITTAGSYLHHYSKEYPAKAREIIEHLEQEVEKSKKAELRQLFEDLKAGFFSIASADGLKSLSQLISEYEQLQTALDQQRATDPLSISLIPGLAKETYLRGLGVLSDALELMKVIHTPGRDNLEKEIAGLEKGIQTLTGSPGQDELIKVKKGSLAFCRERLDILNQLQLHIEQLLYNAQRCESVLHSTRIELAGIRIDRRQTSLDAVVESLQERIKQVKEVQEELKKLGH